MEFRFSFQVPAKLLLSKFARSPSSGISHFGQVAALGLLKMPGGTRGLRRRCCKAQHVQSSSLSSRTSHLLQQLLLALVVKKEKAKCWGLNVIQCKLTSPTRGWQCRSQEHLACRPATQPQRVKATCRKYLRHSYRTAHIPCFPHISPKRFSTQQPQ